MLASVMFISLLLSLSTSLAQASPCSIEQTIGHGVVASRFLTLSLGCVVQITLRSKAEMRYREFWIDERGRFMVFVSVPGEDADKFTGTRTYFLFPRRQTPEFTTLPSGDLSLRLASGQNAVFSGTDGHVLSFPAEFREDPSVSLENAGGLELRSFRGILLDTGWMVGHHSYRNPQGKSVLSDAQNHKCEIQNDEFFFYKDMYYEEPNLLYADDASLEKFLRVRCPGLDLESLK